MTGDWARTAVDQARQDLRYELVALHQTWRGAGDRRTDVTPANLEDWRTMNHSFESVGGYAATRAPLTLSGRGEPQRLDAVIVDSGFFETLGVKPAAGRVFTADEDRVTFPVRGRPENVSSRREGW